jgi:N-acetylglucosamine-6-phosphate deacetylase
MARSPPSARARAAKGAPILCPAPIDLQVNGGGGRMLGECEGPGDVLDILAAHHRLGTGAILPTLISDSPRVTERVAHLVATARRADDGILGLHLEGPHIARPGAHDPAHLRDLTEADIATYAEIRGEVGHLLITLAPERATPEQIAQLAGPASSSRSAIPTAPPIRPRPPSPRAPSWPRISSTPCRGCITANRALSARR